MTDKMLLQLGCGSNKDCAGNSYPPEPGSGCGSLLYCAFTPVGVVGLSSGVLSVSLGVVRSFTNRVFRFDMCLLVLMEIEMWRYLFWLFLDARCMAAIGE